MSELAVFLWWWMATAVVAGWLLRASPRLGSAALRWPVAVMIVLMFTGAVGIVGAAVGVPTRVLRWGVGFALVASVVLFYLRRRKRGDLAWLEVSDEETKPISAPQALTYLALFVLLLTAGTCIWLVLTASAGSSEFFAYNATARAAAIEGQLQAGALSHGERWLPFPIALQSIFATTAGGWSLLMAKLPYVLVWVAALCFALARLREARHPLAGASLTLALVLLLPSLLTLIGRGSDFAWVSACAVASAAAWLHPRRPVLALLFSTAAFVWSPSLGWPLALASALFALIAPLPQRQRDYAAYAVMALAFIVAMLALQSEVFLPASASAWFRNAAAAPMWSQLSLWQSAGLVACALGLFAVAVVRSQRAASSALALRWYISFALLAIIASLRIAPAALGAADTAYDLAIVLLAPSLLLVAASTFTQQIYALSHYVSAPQVLVAGAAVLDQNSVDADAIVTQLPPALDHEQMREVLLRGYAEFGQGNLSDATTLANEVLVSDGNHPDAHHLLAHIALQENRPGDALRAAQRAIDVFPEHALFHLTVSDIYGSQQRWAEQADALALASRLDPTDVGTKTKLLLARRKALMAQAQRESNLGGNNPGTDAYEIYVTRPDRN
jgi:tetratricopeptide (TPR) repeat protein